MRALIGLGNPGEKYERTRHNVGFVCVDALAQKLELSWKKFKDGELAEGQINGEKILLFKPMQFMNQSGMPVRQLVDYFSLPSEDICVVTDDVYIAPGTARIRQGGGDSGHNGMRSLIDHLDPDTFWRVRIGMGLYEQHLEKRAKQPPLDEYVLQRPPAHDQKTTEKLIDNLLPNLILWLEHGTLSTETVHV
jgi:PTH1 family peptidyl-tRNA hydrolase